MIPLAHAGDWISTGLEASPVIFIVVWLVVRFWRDRRAAGEEEADAAEEQESDRSEAGGGG